ncbi:hypothetical protein BOTBODRAFT_628578 [Botryobasidium botryosum FD-172 SS1]|uniref:DUF6532 domain-containing protein n=1 Tax=Botryobasidium botryosum (strain FD-172 SS1) TaxID=930990 RepID=A0A067MS95_BOTB1|nr:hypothetical protein BOTBODRAFT_628578 [Botryobasidium botryosum FD-172 SS1]
MTAERQRRGSWKMRENENIALEAAALSRQKEAQKKKRQHPRDPEDVVAEKRLQEYNNNFIVSTETESAVPKKYRRKEIFKTVRPQSKKLSPRPQMPQPRRSSAGLGPLKHASRADQDVHPVASRQSAQVPSDSLVRGDSEPTIPQSQNSRQTVDTTTKEINQAERRSDDNEGHGREDSGKGEGEGEEESESDDRRTRAPRGTANTNSSRPKIADYPSSTQAVLNLACGLFRSRLATEAPFASPNQEKRLSEETFASACETLSKDYEATEDQLIVIRKGACQMRGKLKELAETAVPLFHKFTRGALHAHKNRLQYRMLTTKDAYTHEDPENLVGIWFTPLLFTLVHGMWFKKEDDDGIKFSRYFRPEIRCVLDEWKEGTYRRHDYKTNIYRHIYKTHLSGLHDLRSTPDGAKVFQSLGAELWESSSSQFSDSPGSKALAFDPAANARAMEHFLARTERKRIEREENIASEVAY